MNPEIVSAFNLPEAIRAKASTALIGPDEVQFSAIADTLKSTIENQQERLEELLQSPGGIGQASMDRDMEIHRTSARLRLLQRFNIDLCLGRIDYPNGTAPVYIGRLGLSDSEGRQLLVDWRSPAAEPFFAATHANPMGLTSRRRYRWNRARVVDYWDEVFVSEGFTEHAAALDDQSAFIASLGTSRSAGMRDVLGTIQNDQDAIIRAGSNGALVVDGGPGTGKTVVALHRSAYLLYSDQRVREHTGGVLFVGPHQPYLAYVEDVLPSLGEDGVQTCTLADLVPEGVNAQPESDPRIAELKASVAMIGAVEAAIAFYEEPPTTELTVATDLAEASLTAEDWTWAFDAPGTAAAHNEVRDQILDELVTLLTDKVEDEIDDDGNLSPKDELRTAFRTHEELVAELRRTWPILDYTDIVRDLWSVPAYLRRCAPWLTADEIALLQRPSDAPWTTSDLPLLDAARQRLGDPHLAQRQRQHQFAIAKEREHIDRVVDDFSAEAEGDEYGVGLVTMLRHEDFNDALIDTSGLQTPAPDLLAGPFAHIVVDEAQELTDAQWQMLLVRCPSRSFTIVGDRAQARRGFTESWTDRLTRIGINHATITSLSINYRTPGEVMDAAEPVIRAALPDANVPTSIRRNGLPVRHEPIAHLDSMIDSWLAENPEGTACVIGAADYEPCSARVRHLSPELAKGLEFDLVVLVEPEQFGSGIAGSVDQYVAMTRATQQLVILSGRLAPRN